MALLCQRMCSATGAVPLVARLAATVSNKDFTVINCIECQELQEPQRRPGKKKQRCTWRGMMNKMLQARR